ncbi:type IV secretory system conjugative DNA transfer family protein [Luteococcus sp. H138]|uniref:VirD4-like conjugal transfer protein, CD1115 family n=1 Tax=unclassified Luteococcus TaxID=2639923 RepID=UPI00313D5A06
MKKVSSVLLVVLFGAVFWLGDRVTEGVRHGTAGKSGQALLKVLPDVAGMVASRIKADPLTLSTARPDLIGGVVAAVLLFLIVMYAVTSKVTRRPGEEQGSAAWATPRDIAPLTTKDRTKRLQLTATESLAIDTRKTQRNLNVLVVGGAGTRKTRGYVMPNLAQVDMSSAITDPKGEIQREIGPTLESRGYDVRTFNLIDLQHSHHFNAFKYFDEENPETSVMQLAECIMTNTSGTEGNKGDAFWDRAERALLTALIAYVWATVADQDDREASLVDVVDLQKQMAASEEAADSFESTVDQQMAAARELVAEWRDQAEVSDPQEELVMNVLDFATRQYRTFEQGAGETKKSIIISLGVRLAPLDMNAVRRIIADDNLDLDELGQKPMALFLAIPDTHQTFRFLATIFWTTLYSHNIYLADHSETGHLPRPVHTFLDEFANIGKIPGFPQLVATMRSRGLSTSIIIQSNAQGKELWKEAWPGVVGNCDTLLYLGGRDFETHKWISEQLGDQTVVTQETSKTYGVNNSQSRSNHIIKRSLMTPDEVGRMSNELAILIVRGLRPFKSRKAQLHAPK